MKHFGLTLLAWLAGSCLCLAGVVTSERSARFAGDFMSVCPGLTKSGDKASVHLVASYPVSDEAPSTEAPAFYVYGRESGGYVIVSGDDAARPVLGFSESGSFPTDEQMPVNMKSLLDYYARVIGFARLQGWEADPATRLLWENPASAVPSSQSVLLTTASWNQFAPFNDLCPVIDGERCPCGCVVTAMAIIMRYHKWPEKGTGSLPSYQYGWDVNTGEYRYQMDGVTLGDTYNWDKMPMDYGGSYSQEAGSQVARLIRDLGVMAMMDYAPEGSGASGASPLLLATYFGYDKQLRYLDRSQYSDERWESMIRSEIDAGRPVFHCGYTSQSGHAFVLDGYRDRYFHINYGWGGHQNEFYTMTPVEGHEQDLTDFNKYQDMVTHIMPDQGGTPYVSLEFYPWSFSPFCWDFRSDTFHVAEGELLCVSSTGDGPTELCYCLYDKEGKWKETLCEPFVVTSQGASPIALPEVLCKAPSQTADGDRIMLSRQAEDVGWEPLSQYRANYLEFEKERPLSELVSIGHTYGYADNWQLEQPGNLFFQPYKDIYWEVRSRDGRVIMSSVNSDKPDRYEVDGFGHFLYLNEMEDNNPRKDRPYFEFFYLPPGEYILFFRNFDEELEIKVTL